MMLCEYSRTIKEDLQYYSDSYFGLNRYLYDNGIIFFLFCRFFMGVVWYRKFAKGTLSEETPTIFMIRLAYDFVLFYPFIFFFHRPSDSDNDVLYFSVVALNVLLTTYLYYAGYKRAAKKNKACHIHKERLIK